MFLQLLIAFRKLLTSKAMDEALKRAGKGLGTASERQKTRHVVARGYKHHDGKKEVYISVTESLRGF